MGNERRSGQSPDLTRYQGFKGSWDKELGAFVFVSKEERDRFQVATYGAVRNGFREPDEPTDDRPGIDRDRCRCKGCREHSGFWRDQSERLEYADAVETNLINPGEGPMRYAQRISGLVTERYGQALQRMPRRGVSRRETDQQLAKLRAQARGMGEGWEDYDEVRV